MGVATAECGFRTQYRFYERLLTYSTNNPYMHGIHNGDQWELRFIDLDFMISFEERIYFLSLHYIK